MCKNGMALFGKSVNLIKKNEFHGQKHGPAYKYLKN
jgi:hypothetical protein